ncbi:zf-HC2 domain-containing protein [Pseudonocardia hispaniensis]|uniref:Zf-HC2 domain-containing protein n=1 Tax=Pseudonocardia hispaniensis TaxID=904933 RepID=A0ABW1J241_9PSEU
MPEPACQRCRALAAELALGVVDGRDRAGALAHLETCPPCREHVERLTGIGEAIAALPPAAEPPLGFEDRVLQRLTSATVAPRPRRRALPRPPVAAAAVAAAAVFVASGWVLGTTAAPAATPHETGMLVGEMTQDGEYVGRVSVRPGPPSWVLLYLDADTTGLVTCWLERRDGAAVEIGQFSLTGDDGWWGFSAPVDRAMLAGIRVTAADGTPVAHAHFP